MKIFSIEEVNMFLRRKKASKFDLVIDSTRSRKSDTILNFIEWYEVFENNKTSEVYCVKRCDVANIYKGF